VIDGERNLATATAVRVARALGLSGDAADYFVALVAFNQGREPTERQAAYRRMQRFRRFREVQGPDLASDAYHSHWYIPAIRELASTPSFREDAGWIARVLKPTISRREAESGLAVLVDLGLLARDKKGSLKPVHRQVATEPETRSLHVAKFHRSMMARASEAIDEIPRPERDISSITLAVDGAGLAALKARFQEIRRELLDEFASDRQGVQVVQVNFQLFPLSERLDEMRKP
jgi:uncharacterized protein (TIGR02147 family)